MNIFGTSYFISRPAANSYYREQGYSVEDVATKIREGEIHIGEPMLQDGETLVTVDRGRRYAIETK